MPCDYRDYGPDWKWIRRQILDQADHCCEFCGLEHNTWVWRRLPGGERITPDEAAELIEKYRRLVLVVLTIAHLDHDTTNSDPANLRALCQQCHLRWDAKHHAGNAAETRRKKARECGQLVMAIP